MHLVQVGRGGAGRPQLGRRGAGGPVDRDRASAEIGQRQPPATDQRVVHGERRIALLGPDQGGLEALVAERTPDDREIDLTLEQPCGRCVRLHERHRPVLGLPLALDRRGQPPEHRPGEAHPELGRAMLGQALDQRDLGQHPPGVLGDPTTENRGSRTLAGAQQQPASESPLQLRHRAGDRGLGGPQRDRRVGEGALVDDRDQGTQLAQVGHTLSV